MRTIEICCGSIADVKAARYGGAARVELCEATEIGGLTPSAGLIAGAIREREGMKVHVLIRPRGCDFVYTPEEVSVMEADIAAARMAGADGVVIGALTSDGELDLPAMKRMLRQAEGMSVTFHRAFDVCARPLEVIDRLCELGVDRILTSGHEETAMQGVENLADYVKHAAGRIIILPGSGINPMNIDDIERITGAREFHSTATDKKALRRVCALFGPMPPATSEEIVRKLVNN
ncbi:MAG: copper homeostasis protein CutC [Bacteroidales bacterium]|nr:copper homeostasis protein CutC [Bacteroidales bacterium]